MTGDPLVARPVVAYGSLYVDRGEREGMIRPQLEHVAAKLVAQGQPKPWDLYFDVLGRASDRAVGERMVAMVGELAPTLGFAVVSCSFSVDKP